jgi:hypothetical protein
VLVSRGVAAWLLLAGGLVIVTGAARSTAQPAPSPERRAVAYLAVEVPRWRREHPCYSCHNNGDGTRALIAASRRGLIDASSLGDAVDWLRTPERWALNAEDGGVKDLPLARIQFASALQLLADANSADATALDRAAPLLIADQRPDGSWPISAAAAIGSPAGYGTPLATAAARRVLAAARGDDARLAVARADAWFRASTPESVLDASAVLLGLATATDAPAVATRQRALQVLKRGQAPDGGWGPYATSPSEPFDTAVAMLALVPLQGQSGVRTGSEPSGTEPLTAPAFSAADLRTALTRARAYLVAQQSDDGSWPETTRPALQESYAQRISTTGWATLALLATP